MIIGYGNSLRGDDGVGAVAAELLSAEVGIDEEVICCHQLTPELSCRLSRADRVVFIDARAIEGKPGEIRVQRVEQPDGNADPFSHASTPGQLLSLARNLFGHTPEAFLLTVEGESFGLGAGLSPRVEAALPQVVALARRLLRPVPEENQVQPDRAK